jgi:hypothetical protein
MGPMLPLLPRAEFFSQRRLHKQSSFGRLASELLAMDYLVDTLKTDGVAVSYESIARLEMSLGFAVYDDIKIGISHWVYINAFKKLDTQCRSVIDTLESRSVRLLSI